MARGWLQSSASQRLADGFDEDIGVAHLLGDDDDGCERLLARLKTLSGPKTYFCQASELLKATNQLSRWERFAKCFTEVQAGNCSALAGFGALPSL